MITLIKRVAPAALSLTLALSAGAQTPITGAHAPWPDTAAYQALLSGHFNEMPAGRKVMDVTVSACIDAKGGVSDVKLVESGGAPALDAVTLEGIAAIPFTPAANAEGSPIATCSPPFTLMVRWQKP